MASFYILFNFDINDLFLFTKQATLDNTVAYFSESMPDVVETLEKRNRSGFIMVRKQ